MTEILSDYVICVAGAFIQMNAIKNCLHCPNETSGSDLKRTHFFFMHLVALLHFVCDHQDQRFDWGQAAKSARVRFLCRAQSEIQVVLANPAQQKVYCDRLNMESRQTGSAFTVHHVLFRMFTLLLSYFFFFSFYFILILLFRVSVCMKANENQVNKRV